MFSIFRLSSIVQPLMDGSRYVCWVLLAFYMWRVLLFVFKGKKEGGARRDGMREAMAMAYTLVAAYFILSATKAVQPFMVNILDSVSSLRPQPQAEELTLLELMSAFVFTAFICNFSRSLWMLKSLDHALFEPVPQWGELSGRSAWKRAAEFATRTVAAVLFILVEFRLERLAATQTQSFVPNENLVLAGGGWATGSQARKCRKCRFGTISRGRPIRSLSSSTPGILTRTTPLGSYCSSSSSGFARFTC
jgi:hypothetical protein